MASISAIAGIRADSMKRLLVAAARIAESTTVDAPAFETFRQPDYEQAMQLQALAVWAEAVAESLNPSASETEDATAPYAGLTRSELVAIADKRKMLTDKRQSKEDLIRALERYDKVTSETQE